jgi:hypothetical protein
MSSPPAHLTHGGVWRTAGVIHVGAPHIRARAYVRDARGYSHGLMVEHHLAEARRAVAEGDECQRRSWVAAVADLARWMNDDASTGGAP